MTVGVSIAYILMKRDVYKRQGQKFVIIIDEWDVLIRIA